MRNNSQRIFALYGLYFAWIVAIVATCSSLYLSEVMLFPPCKLCWYQRIFMYPLIFLLGVAVLKKDKGVYKYALTLSVVGGSISIYHYLIQRFPDLENIAPCTAGNQIPCNIDYLNWFGFVTIPLLALVAFILITTFLVLSMKANKALEQSEEHEEEHS